MFFAIKRRIFYAAAEFLIHSVAAYTQSTAGPIQYTIDSQSAEAQKVSIVHMSGDW